MALFKFLRTPDPNQYDYKPRFWDPEKERIEKRLAELESRKHMRTADDVKGSISGSFKAGRRGKGSTHEYRIMRRTAHRKSNYMLLAIILVLVLLGYALLNLNLQRVLEFLN